MSHDTMRKPHRDRGRAFFGAATALTLVLAGALGARLMDDVAVAAPVGPVGQAIQPLAPAQQPFSFADLVERVAPAVVSVRVEARIEQASADPRTDRMMRRFFEEFGVPMPEGGEGGDGGEAPRGEAMGSGFIVDGAGYIVTNNHVIDKAEKITVILNDGKELDAKLIGTDPGTDIAVLKVDSSQPLPFVQFGDDAKLRTGDWVVAVGNPFGLGGTVTAGILSARGRNIGAGPYTDYHQIDAPINRGTSGGPTFNIAGEVVGVNTAIYTPTGGSVGIGFAVPAATVTKIVAQLREHGSVTRGWLGVQIQPIDAEMAKAVGLSEPRGALVSMVTPGSPAEKAGFKTGDVVVKANGQDVTDNRALSRLVADLKVGDSATFEVWRDSASQTLTATIELRDDAKLQAQLGGAPSDPGLPGSSEALPGVQLSALTDEIRRAMGVGQDVQGVVVTNVEQGSDAANKGLAKGALVIGVGNKPVSSVEDVVSAVAEAKNAGRSSLPILVEENGVRRYVPLGIG